MTKAEWHQLHEFGGMEVRQVEAGTVITNPQTGEKLIVTDQEAVALFDILYVTEPTYVRIQAEVARVQKEKNIEDEG